MTTCCCGSCSTCCPNVVSTVNQYSTTISATNALSLSVDNSGGASGNKSIALQVQDSDGDDASGTFVIRLWFVDSNDKDAEKSLIAPDVPGGNELEIVTAADGSYTLTVSHAGALDEWYVCAEILGLVYIDGPLNLGV